MLEEGSLLEVFAIDDDVRSEVVVTEVVGNRIGEWMTRVSRRLARKSTSLVRPSQGMQEPTKDTDEHRICNLFKAEKRPTKLGLTWSLWQWGKANQVPHLLSPLSPPSQPHHHRPPEI